MKKFILIAAVGMASAALALSASAQEKGQLTVGGSIGVNGGSTGNTFTYQGTTDKESSPNTLNFTLNPMVSYFVIDNLELTAGLDYRMSRELEGTDQNGKNYFTFTHLAGFKIGANYWLPIVDGVLYYTPGVSFSIGGGSLVLDVDENTTETTKFPFAFAFAADLGKFEVKVLPYLGVNFNLLTLGVDYVNVDLQDPDSKFSTNIFNAGFNLGMNVGVRYYF